MPVLATRPKSSRRHAAVAAVAAATVVVLGPPTLLTGALAALVAGQPGLRVSAEGVGLAGARLLLLNAEPFGPAERDLVARVRAAHPHLPIVAVVPEIPGACRAGVDAFVPSSTAPAQLMSVLRALLPTAAAARR